MEDCWETVVLNRIVRWVLSGNQETELSWRQMHVMFPSSGLDSRIRSVVSHGNRSVEPRGDELDENRRAIHKSAARTLAYLSQDRPELAFARKEIARSMQTLNEVSWMALKRAVRFSMGTPRAVFEK